MTRLIKITPLLRNYTITIIGCILVLATALYFLYARGRYIGPTTFIDATRVMTNTSVDIVRADDEPSKIRVDTKST